MQVEEIWRYPVKSLAGERLDEATLGVDGIAGDRRVYIEQGARVITARTHPGLLGLHGTLSANGVPLVDGEPWTSPGEAAAVAAAAGAAVTMVEAPEGLFDVLPLSVATDGTAAHLGIDHRRLRPNIVIGGVDGLAERLWPGAHMRIGDAVLYLARLRPRCVMTTYDPDTQAQDHTVLRRIVHELEGTASLDTAVVEPGIVRVGDAVSVVRAHTGRVRS